MGRLNAIPGVHCQMPEGAFYAWVSFDVDMTSDEMCDYILDHAKVVGVSGAAYGMTQGCFLRFSFASDDAALSAAADRIEAAMRAYQHRSPTELSSCLPLPTKHHTPRRLRRGVWCFVSSAGLYCLFSGRKSPLGWVDALPGSKLPPGI